MNSKPPVLLLGGHENTLAMARSLSELGIKVVASTHKKASIQYSRYCHKLYSARPGEDFADYWRNLLLDAPRAELSGSVILSCGDEAVEFVALNRDRLARRYILEENIPELQLALLDKYQTFLLANKADIAAPQCWSAAPDDPFYRDMDIRFPVLVKPLVSHLYQRVFDFKLLPVENREQLEAHLAEVYRHDLQVMLTEHIPGPDSNLSSYYTYVDASGRCLFNFTKRVIRRFPKNFGAGSYHITQWLPEVARTGRQFFSRIGYRGLGNVEFKLDMRDNTLKLIECNPRFTAAHELLVKSGMSTDRIVYNIVTGTPYNIPNSFREFERLIYPWQDLRAYLERSRLGELNLRDWLQSISHPQNFPFYRWGDPLPAIAQFLPLVHRGLKKGLRL